MAAIAYTIPNEPNVSFLAVSWLTIWEIRPKPGKIKI